MQPRGLQEIKPAPECVLMSLSNEPVPEQEAVGMRHPRCLEHSVPHRPWASRFLPVLWPCEGHLSLAAGAQVHVPVALAVPLPTTLSHLP